MKLYSNIVSLIIINLVCTCVFSDSGENLKSKRRYRSKFVSNKVSNQSAGDVALHASNTSNSIFPSATISSSRNLEVSGNEEFNSHRNEGDETYFNPDFDAWGQPQGSSYGYGNSKPHYIVPTLAPRYIPPEKSSSSLGLIHSEGGGEGSGQIYTSYPIGAGKNYYNNPILDTYPYYYQDKAKEKEQEMEKERERTARAKDIFAQVPSSKTSVIENTNNINPFIAAAASSLLANAGASSGSDLNLSMLGDSLALGSGWNGWGWKPSSGWGWGWGGINHNAVGLLGLLALLSLLSNILFVLATTTAAAARKKRSLSQGIFNHEDSLEDRRRRIFYEVLPYLSPIAHARNGLIPTDCTLQGICLTNTVIIKEMGWGGKMIGDRITSAISAILGEMNEGKQGQTAKQISKAGWNGRHKKNCHRIYPSCEVMKTPGAHSVPFFFRMEEVPHMIANLKRITTYVPPLL